MVIYRIAFILCLFEPTSIETFLAYFPCTIGSILLGHFLFLFFFSSRPMYLIHTHQDSGLSSSLLLTFSPPKKKNGSCWTCACHPSTRSSTFHLDQEKKKCVFQGGTKGVAWLIVHSFFFFFLVQH
jgi:hypothetical protein